MNAHKISIKLYATADHVAEDAFIPVFHRWIQNNALADHLLIDVTDYAHVPHGPGTVLVSHEANIYADHLDGRLGITYGRKQPVAGSFRDRVRQALGAALTVAGLIEADEAFAGQLAFRTDEITIRLNDRLLAPNTAETFARVKEDIAAVAVDLFGPGAIVERAESTPQDLFTVTVRPAQVADRSVTELAERLSSPAA